MEFSSPAGAYTGPPFADVEFGEKVALLTLANGDQIALNEIVCRDVTQLSGYASWAGNLPSGVTGVSPQPDMVVRAGAAYSGAKVYGVLKSVAPGLLTVGGVAVDNGATGATTGVPGIKNTSGSTQTYLVVVKFVGYGLVWAKANSGGNAVNVGSNLVATPGTTNCAVQGAFAGLKNIGTALATVIGGSLVSTGGSALITVPGSNETTTLVNCDIDCE